MTDLKERAEALDKSVWFALVHDEVRPTDEETSSHPLILAALREAEKRGAVAALEEACDWVRSLHCHEDAEPAVFAIIDEIHGKAQRLRDEIAKGGTADE